MSLSNKKDVPKHYGPTHREDPPPEIESRTYEADRAQRIE